MLESGSGELEPLPLVSAVIPTRNRPQLILRAVGSVLRQTYKNIEIIVVIDGSDPATEESLSTVKDLRLRVIALKESVGGSEARNWGVRESHGKWIALLDDDDEWREDKIARQLETAECAENPYVMVFSKMTVKFPNSEVVWPRRLPHANEPISDYLFTRKGLSFGDGFLQTSSFFASRTMFDEVPFRKGLKRFQDTDWLLRAGAHPRARIEVIAEPLVTYYMDSQQAVSRKPDWEYLYNWAQENRPLFTRRAYSFFLATVCVPRAAKQREPIRVFLKLLKECAFSGSPTFNCLVICFNLWFIPDTLRQNLRESFSKWKSLVSGFRRPRALSEIN